MRAITAAIAVLAATVTGCSTAAPPVPSLPPPTATPQAPAASAPPSMSAKPTPAAPRMHLIKIPNVAGINHQTAQDTMQAAGLYNLRERDATGQGRLLLWDRNWVVVRQSPPAGRRVSPDTVITLFSKKIGE